MDSTNLSVGNSLYVSTKYALARWIRRVSATWAANGVRINAVAPGNVHTAMTATMSTTAKMALNALPIPTKYGQECLMAPEEIAEVMVFLASNSARGVNGNIMFVDGGTDALLNSERYIKEERTMRPIEKYVEAMENKDLPDLQSCSLPTAFCVTIVPPPLPSRSITSTEKKPLTCSSVINSASAVTPF